MSASAQNDTQRQIQNHDTNSTSMRFIVTGGSRGLGRALARELIANGDTVLLTSRSQESATKAAQQILTEARKLPHYKPGGVAHGVACDVSCAKSVASLTDSARTLMDGADAWICNAGASGDYGWFLDQDAETTATVVRTNLVGGMLCAQQALRLFQEQRRGALFFVDGAGADGLPTPHYAAYGASKAAVAQMWGSIQDEAKSVGASAHVLSPGMILTPLLLEGTDTADLAPIFNVLCEHAEVPAAFLAPRARELVNASDGAYVRYLSIPRVAWRFVTWPWRRNRHFDEANGLKLYSDSFAARMESDTRDVTRERESRKRERALAYAAVAAASTTCAAAMVVLPSIL